MRTHYPRFTISTAMVSVVVIALMLTFLKSTNHIIRFIFIDRGWFPGSAITAFLVVVVAAIATFPFMMAGRAILRAIQREGDERKRKIHPVIAATAWIVLGAGLAQWPWVGGMSANILRDGSYVIFYHQFRIWPGREVTPCLELRSPAGKTLRNYTITDNISYLSIPEVRTSRDQTEIWLVEGNALQKRPDHVLCSLNRETGRFVGPSGTHPLGISATSGFPPTR
jgi:hypothetical protein